MNDEKNDVQDPAEPYKVTEEVVTKETLPDQEAEAPPTPTPTETTVEKTTETVTESPVSDSSDSE